MTSTPDYKATIRLPQTDFPMKGDLPIKEPKIIESWDKNAIYKKMSTKNAGKKKSAITLAKSRSGIAAESATSALAFRNGWPASTKARPEQIHK